MRKFTSLVGLAMIIASCTNLSKEDCQSMNWFEKGKLDGMKGRSSQAFSDYSSACSKHSISTDQDAYLKGRTAGLQIYCTYEQGYQSGLNGNTYLGVCLQNSEADFLKGYHLGTRELEIKKKEKELEQRELQLKSQGGRTKACTFNSDCRIDGKCTFGKCTTTGKQCTFDSSCQIEGQCKSESKWLEGRYVYMNTCKYD